MECLLDDWLSYEVEKRDYEQVRRLAGTVRDKCRILNLPWPPVKTFAERQASSIHDRDDGDATLEKIFQQEIADYDTDGNARESVRTVAENCAAIIKAELERRGLWVQFEEDDPAR
ncbi:hypothetical protein BDW02DRAFT_633925 [Decorospora gaudefroyi]|uniref:Uncharacterized protein n=1 Tax=Decorospora gaudefroyi TaxID=184978 RepID=A0A6A5K0A6_9PLEO|nr:hypothetical protein BDW02DRAFT_633925 [Decorospora gaudefroyi]